jgi:HSP20 family molecular chaperone IbpA
MQRTLPMPKGANHDGAIAKFENGVLTVSFPKVKGGGSDAGRKLQIK